MQLRLHRVTARYCIISDVRFEAEAEFVRQHGILIKVVRGTASAPEAQVDRHLSEAGVDALEAAFVIDNSGTLQHLQCGAAHLAESIDPTAALCRNAL